METEERSIVGTPADLPIWARLAFAKMIPEVYFFDRECTKPRKPQDATVEGFVRTGDMIEIYYAIDWPDEELGHVTHLYNWPTFKNVPIINHRPAIV